MHSWRRSPSETVDAQRRLNAYFEQVAPYWSEVYERQCPQDLVYQDRLRIVLELVDGLVLPGEARVLDVGCGTGMAAVALAMRGHVVEAVDAVPAMIKATRQRSLASKVEARVRSLVGDVNFLPFPDASYDLVIAMGVLPWVTDYDPPVREMARVLKPGGRLVLTVDHVWGARQFFDPSINPFLHMLRGYGTRAVRILLGPSRRWVAHFLNAGRHNADVHARLTSVRECDKFLGKNNMQRASVRSVGFGPLTFFHREILSERIGARLHKALQRLADRDVPLIRDVGSQLVVLAEKLADNGGS